jgi:hypothetical protein
MAKNPSDPKEKPKLDLGKFFKGLFKGKKGASEAPSELIEEAAVEAEASEEIVPRPSIRPRPVTKATIEVSRQERVFHHLAVIGPTSGALNNMVQILLRRGYDVDHIEMVSAKRGTFERHELKKEIEPNCECLILFEPSTLDQAKTILADIRKKTQIPMVAIGRQFTTPNWANEILKTYEMTDRFLIRFTFNGLLKLFHRIRMQSISGAPRPAPAPEIPKAKPKPRETPKPEREEEEEVILVDATSEIQTEAPLVEAKDTALVEVPPEELYPDLEKKSIVISEGTSRPFADLAAYAEETRARYRIDGRQDEGIEPDRFLTRKEFENLFQPRVQELWHIELTQDPRALPPIIIDLDRVPEEEEGLEGGPEEEMAPEPVRAPEPATVERKPAPLVAPSQPKADLSERIKEVRKWWQAGRTNRIYGEMETARRSVPEIDRINREAFFAQFVPLVEGAILFAKGRLDRTVESTLEELFREDFTKNGLLAPLRILALLSAVGSSPYDEVFGQVQETIVKILKAMIPAEEQKETFTASIAEIRGQLTALDQLVDSTLDAERISPALIFDYFEKLQKITLALHEEFKIVDPELSLFGRLDGVIVRSQVRSDWAFDHSEESDQWHDRMIKFLHFLAEIRIDIFRAQQELNLLTHLLQAGLDAGVAETRALVLTDTLLGETLERLDQDHLKEPRNATIWHIRRHWGNYLIDLMNEEDDSVRAFATFDEENIVYTWLGLYQGVIPTEETT